jgi:hypothetical protein
MTLPATTDSASGSVVRSGTRGYFVSIGNQGPSTINGATVTLTSGLPLSFFPGIGSLPVVGGPATFAPGESSGWVQFNALCCTLVPSSFAPGYDTARSMSQLRIPVGGATQTVQVSVRLTDPAYGPAHLFSFGVALGSPTPQLPGVTVVSAFGPSNLNEGETIAPGGGPPTSLVDWTVHGGQLNKLYTFTVTLNVPNPFGVPFDFKPWVATNAVPFASSSTTGLARSVFVPEPSLDGPAGLGGVTFSVDQPTTWQVVTNEGGHGVSYDSLLQPLRFPTSPDECKNGGWQGYGVFKNQGDCVSYLATQGGNPPAG